ncbi:hypothetical protein GQ53DRAFT_45743 [Thozetella sp. PMI_491]|nr:hypothetical protein GQ53DRAFT_45743 [Thozetella sp. PMI_491]
MLYSDVPNHPEKPQPRPCGPKAIPHASPSRDGSPASMKRRTPRAETYGKKVLRFGTPSKSHPAERGGAGALAHPASGRCSCRPCQFSRT